MKNNQLQDKYNEIFGEIKKEKLDWDFEDFLKKTDAEESAPIIHLQNNTDKKIPKIVWIAASFILIFGLGLAIMLTNKNSVEDKNHFVKIQIEKQKKDFVNENQLAYQYQQKDSVNIENDSIIRKDSISSDTDHSDEIMDKILSRKSRLRRQYRQKYAYSNQLSDTVRRNDGYNPNYVVVNGRKIYDEKEAIDVTKQAFKIIASNVTETINETKVINELNVDF